MSKHTPGPWGMRPKGKEEWAIDATSFDQFGHKIPWREMATVFGDEEYPEFSNGMANARLISAAPDMYEALKEATDILQRMEGSLVADVLCDGFPDTDEVDALRARLCSALAKAEGKL